MIQRGETDESDHYKLIDHPWEYVVEDICKGHDVIASVTNSVTKIMAHAEPLKGAA